MVRSIKNAFAPINWIPYEVLSTIPDYWADEDMAGEDLITLTHVCHGWRELFISCPSLWTCLDYTSVERTRLRIERSKSSPLKVYLREERYGYKPFSEDALLLTIPHLGRLKSLSIVGSEECFVELVNKHFNCPAPFLEKLFICFHGHPFAITAAILDGNPSSLRELDLHGAITDLPWKNLANLTTFDFRQASNDEISVTQLLDFFEHARLLRNIQLLGAFPTTSNAPLGRVVSLPSLKKLRIIDEPAHSILLNHLLIPSGALLVLEFDFDSEESPITAYLPGDLKNINNLSSITSINLCYKPRVALRLDGPSGGLHVLGTWTGAATPPPIVHHLVLRSLNRFCISATERFAVAAYSTPLSLLAGHFPPYQTLLLMNALRTLVLIDGHNVPFIAALNPCRIPSGTLVCPKLKDLVLYIKKPEWFCIRELLEMAKERSSRGARLSTIKIFSPQELVPAKEVLKLRDHVSCVKYRLDDVVPVLDEIPNDVKGPRCECGWW